MTREVQRGLVSQAVYSTLRFIARHVEGFFGAVTAFITAGFVLSLVAVAAFWGVARAVTGGLTQSVDDATLRWIAQHRSPAWDHFMEYASRLGTGVVLIMIVAVASAFLWVTRHRWSVYVLLVGTIGGVVLNSLLKLAFNRPRPDVVEVIDVVRTSSFPSGHSMTSLVTYGSVAYLIARLEPSPRFKWLVRIVATLVIAIIGISRMYLGVHYPSDVFAGFVAGAAWLAIVAWSVTAIRYFAHRRPETKGEERDLERR